MIPISGFDDMSYTTRIVAATTTVTGNDYIISVQAPTANVVINLPAASAALAGRRVTIQKDATATYTVAITPAGTNNLNGANSAVTMAAAALKSCDVFCDGAAWWTVPGVPS